MKDYKTLDYCGVEEEIRYQKVLLKFSQRALEKCESFKTQTERLRDELDGLELHFKMMNQSSNTSGDDTSLEVRLDDSTQSPTEPGHA